MPSFVRRSVNILLAAGGCLLCLSTYGWAQTLDERLKAQPVEELARAAREQGDAKRGAILFFQPYMACTKCHVHGQATKTLGPDLTTRTADVTDSYLIESILHPSKVIKKGFDSATVVTVDGKTITGLIVEDKPERLILRDATQGREVVIQRDDIDEVVKNMQSIMPAGQVNQLASRQQFLDLLRYVTEISVGGLAKARELQPPPSAYAARPLPEYEKDIDHAGMISSFDRQSFKRGEAIYNRLCINCHGTHDKPGSLPTSLRFASGKFKNGSDPYTMYQTLTRGFGMMVPQMWMVPQQKYDVIHYVCEAYLKSHNEAQYVKPTADYLTSLPKGSTRGPEPSNILPWEQMDYGHNLVATYEIGRDASNFAYKGNAIRLDAGPGGVSQGRYWMIFDYDTMRMAAAWSGKGFINWNGINFDGRHNIHPRIVGQVHAANNTGPGWANPVDGEFVDPRLRGRDGRAYGPLPRDWAHYKGMYYHGQKVVIAYTVGETNVLEMPGLVLAGETPVFTRTLNIGSRETDLTLRVATEKNEEAPAELSVVERAGQMVSFGESDRTEPNVPERASEIKFNGGTRVDISEADDLDLRDRDYSIVARIKTRKGGTIFAKTANAPKWVPDGKAFFVRGGRLCFDIGWVGVVQSNRRVNDGKWHDVAMTYAAKTGLVRLFVDGKEHGNKQLRPKNRVANHIARIGYTSSDFPRPQSFFDGEISEVAFYSRVLAESELPVEQAKQDGLVGRWVLTDVKGELIEDVGEGGHDGRVFRGGKVGGTAANGPLIAGIAGADKTLNWSAGDAGELLLTIPAGPEVQFTLWIARAQKSDSIEQWADAISIKNPAQELSTYLHGGLARWPERLKSKPIIGHDDGPFALDVITHPVDNPWFCRARLTGFDFYPDGDRAVVSAWDGSIWLVSGLSKLPNTHSASDDVPELTWQRIASGLFQPLGVKIIDGKVYVTCRDQLCVLHDLNGDDEIDFFENFNNDHQVTDHFHEFAMGLQADADGNFYYAKSARHALTALVPHHGTLLRISKDGSRTDILATGFRAANGVCLNPDGTFIVTDQEGHWNPKNRINWVTEGGFYGNMFGYHDVTDSSDEAMEQPLCWITNAFDRSPAELLWVDSARWGPLQGSLLNLSYGYGKVYVVPHERINGQVQGGMCALPIPQFPTGVMRGRFHPVDGQLYTCGMFAWAGSQQQPGGFYRIRYTGQPVHLPVALNAKQDGMLLSFSDKIDPKTAAEPSNYSVKVWSLKRTANYGSKHYDEHSVSVTAAVPAADGRSVSLKIPDISPTWCMEIRYNIKSSEGKPIDGVIHNTIHALSD